MPNLILGSIIGLFIIFIIFLFFIVRWVWKKNKKYSAQDYLNLTPKDSTYEFCDISKARSNTQRVVANYLKKLKVHENLIKNDINSIYLVHGSFVGDDPWHTFTLLESSFPKFSKTIIQKLKQSLRKGQEAFAKDLGNFSQAHIDVLKLATDSKIPIINFTWSSANSHLARVIGAFSLLQKIKDDGANTKKILLLGHSHAGQIFSLVTLMLNDYSKAKYFYSLSKDYLEISDLKELLNSFNTTKFEFVTLGTPPRYSWDLNQNMSLTHFINHRGDSPIAGTPLGVVFTRDGDYIQQWGIEGSDLFPLKKIEKEINIELDKYLGVGSNIAILKENIKKRKRLHNNGHHYLVNYRDNAKKPNFLKTAFGHGYYTKLEYFPFIFKKLFE